ncbi:MAG: hypothetical protein AAGC85_18135 [Bacteroidota bacterium]
MKNFLSILLLGWVFLISCEKTQVEDLKVKPGLAFPALTPTTKGDLLSYEKVKTLSPQQILSHIPERNDLGVDLTPYIKNSISLYRVYYSSTLGENPIVLSGMVMVPEVEGTIPHYQYHHGTVIPIGSEALDVPSLYEGNGPTEEQEQFEARILMAIPAAAGFFTSGPDYAGYSISYEKEHPYVNHKELGESSLGMLIASKELAKQLNLSVSQEVFLGGWSEGGGVCLALHKLIEERSLPEIKVAASAPFAGPYHFSRFFREVLSADKSSENTSIYNWGLYVANQNAGNLLAPEMIWKYPVNNQFDAINIPSGKPSKIYQKAFIDSFLAGNSPLIEVAKKNDLHDGWAPSGNVYFHSGKADRIVPHFNSLDAYNGLIGKGSGEVKLYEYEGDHYSPVGSYLVKMIDDFISLK